MAEQPESGDDRTEEATPERRDEFRERGDIALSREVTTVLILLAGALYLNISFAGIVEQSKGFLQDHFVRLTRTPLGIGGILSYGIDTWAHGLRLFVPIGIVAMVTAMASTLAQTRLNFSWGKIKPDFTRLDPSSGLKRMVSTPAVVEMTKSFAKMLVIGGMAFVILRGEWKKVPDLMFFPVNQAWQYWGKISRLLLWTVATLTFVIAGGDFFYNFMSLEKKLRMTKEEVKEEFKKREVDPHVKNRMRRMQRDISSAKMIRATRNATVVITNPTHYSIAIKYTAGFRAPKVVAKGVDFLALRMREVAKEADIPIVENPPLARTLFKIMEVGHEIPETLWAAVSEVIRYVIKLKGWNFVKQQ